MFQPLWKMMDFVSWDDDIPKYDGTNKFHVPNHQPDSYLSQQYLYQLEHLGYTKFPSEPPRSRHRLASISGLKVSPQLTPPGRIMARFMASVSIPPGDLPSGKRLHNWWENHHF